MKVEPSEYKLRIDGHYDAETFPMTRLAEYMQHFATLLGHRSSVHFSHLEKGSAVLVSTVEPQDAPKVDRRVRETRKRIGPQDAANNSEKKKSLDNSRQVVKVDRQIVSIAKVARASAVYTTDRDVVRLSDDAELRCVHISQLELPPQDPQGNLFETNEQDNPQFTEVQQSGDEATADTAATERIESDEKTSES